MGFYALTAIDSNADNHALTKDKVVAAQKAWGEALVKIAETNRTQGTQAAKKVAEEIIDAAYGYSLGDVLFKPTLTVAPQTFRTTKEGALAYFVGQNPNFPNDKGFALKDWRSVDIENASVQIYGNVAHTMGKVRITDGAGNVTEVDKTWAFLMDEAGALRIVLHHSSLPFSAE